jgi:hypothetical protein
MAKVSAFKAEPPLKPYQPNQSSPVPKNVSSSLFSSLSSFYFCGILMKMPKAKAAKPLETWITFPPAKSMTWF